MLLFFDIDGTLFDDSRKLPASVLPAMEKAHENGHLLFINTGRTLCNKDRRLDGFPLDGWIMGCGTRIIFRGKTLQSMEYDPAQSLRLRQIILDLDLPVTYECDTAMYFDPLAPYHPAVSVFREFARSQGTERDLSDADPEFRIVKMFCFADTRDRIDRLEKAAAAIGMPYTAIDRGNGGWEMTPSAFSKGTGIDMIRQKLDIPFEDTLAFGDSTNDMTMFEHVKHSIAMGNASDDVKAACTWVTALPEEDGIKKAMIRFGIIADD